MILFTDRLHVIDSLPNVWMLDGRIITSAERNQVRQFFKDSALSDRPVRHKLPKNQFVPTSLKNIAITGVHGCRTDHLMRNFPNKMTINIDIDKRRLLYLAYNLQQDVNLEIKHKKSEKVKPSKVIEYLINCRRNDQERCNMVLLLLVGSLEFSIPLSLVQHTLEVARLSNIEETRCRVVSLLLSAVKIERDQSIVSTKDLVNRVSYREWRHCFIQAEGHRLFIAYCQQHILSNDSVI
ncbi:uncharacterized protein LOC114575087 isoform X2 [Exaiptasia diaphana]|uniref:Uncharacterized protein n=1 Tax=Exaiptasia diaphana TaxID=2652724 RepID=A0A913YIU8_EXADI|nr:uncharacterized protein LOC114575087 isoform X2 [Exaiptasia diaphana]